MTEESANLTADIRRLEEQVDNLRWTVILLIIIVSILTISVVYLWTSLPTLTFFLASGFIIIACVLLLIRECTKKEENGAPAGT